MMHRHQDTLSSITALKVNYHCNSRTYSSNHDTEFHNVRYPKTRKTLIFAMQPSELGRLTDCTDRNAQNKYPGQRPMRCLMGKCLEISKDTGRFNIKNRQQNQSDPPSGRKKHRNPRHPLLSSPIVRCKSTLVTQETIDRLAHHEARCRD
jgi:integrase